MLEIMTSGIFDRKNYVSIESMKEHLQRQKQLTTDPKITEFINYLITELDNADKV